MWHQISSVYIILCLCTESNGENFLADLVIQDEFLPLATSSEIDRVSFIDAGDINVGDQKTITAATSADLLNAVKLYGNVSDRTAILFLELAKTPGFNPETIKHSDIKKHEELSSTSLILDVLRCRNCGEDLTGQTECSQNWYAL